MLNLDRQWISQEIIWPGQHIAPEIYLHHSKGENVYGCEIDVWAFGVTLFFVLNLQFPFSIPPNWNSERKYQELSKQAQHFSYRKALSRCKRKKNPNSYTHDLEDLFSRVFCIDPEERITASEVCQHPFFAPYYIQVLRKEPKWSNKPVGSPGYVFWGKYITKRKLSAGIFGGNYLVEEGEGGQQRALWAISKIEWLLHYHDHLSLQSEISCLQRMNEEQHISRLEEFNQDNNYYYLVFEYCGGSISNLQFKQPSQVLPLPLAAQYLSQVIAGLDSLHKQGYIHGHINMTNILVKDTPNCKVLKISFYGLTKSALELDRTYIHLDRMRIEDFVAPDVYLKLWKQGKAAVHKSPVDIWAFGVMLFFMLNRQNPFRFSAYAKLQAKYKKLCELAQEFSYRKRVANSNLKIMENCTDDMEDLFSRIFQIDPEKRITASELRKHPVFAPYYLQPQKKESIYPIPIQVKKINFPVMVFIKDRRLLQLELEEAEFLSLIAQELEMLEKASPSFLIFSYSLLKYKSALLRKLFTPVDKDRMQKNPRQLHLTQGKLDFSMYLSNAEQAFNCISEFCRYNYDSICKLHPDFAKLFEGELEETTISQSFFVIYRTSAAIFYAELKKQLKENMTQKLCFLVCLTCIAYVFDYLYESASLKRIIFSAALVNVTDTVLTDQISYKRVADYLRGCQEQELLRLCKKIIGVIVMNQ